MKTMLARLRKLIAKSNRTSAYQNLKELDKEKKKGRPSTKELKDKPSEPVEHSDQSFSQRCKTRRKGFSELELQKDLHVLRRNLLENAMREASFF